MAIKAQGRASFYRVPKGDSAVSYSIIPSVTVIKKSFAGVNTPASVTCNIYKTIGNGTPAIANDATLKYQRSTDATPLNYLSAITTTGYEWIEFTAWKGGVMIDRQTVRVLTDASDIDLGSVNLILNSNDKITSASYLVKEYTLSCDLVRGKTYTIVLKGTYTQGSFGLWLNRGNNTVTWAMTSIADGLFRYTFTINFDIKWQYKNTITIYNYPDSVVHNCTIEWIKLVEGNTTSNDWVAAPEDFQAEYKSYIEATDKRLQAIFTQSSTENLIAKAMASGKCVYPDASFTDDVNGISTYSNSNTGTLTVSRVAMPESPTGSKFGLKIRSVGPTTPGRGGVYQQLDSRANAIFIQRIIARIPKGYSIRFANNNIGLGAKIEWLTSSDGTGNWCEYILCITCGSTQGTSSFNTCGHIYIGGGTFDVALEWEIALMTAYDVTGSDYLVNNKLLNSVKNTLESNITANAKAIATKVSRTDYDSNNNVINSQFTEIKQTASNVSLKVNAIESFSNKPQGMRNYALGTEKIFEVSGFASASNVCVNTYKVRKEVTGGDVCLAFDIELIGCTFASNSTIDLQGDYNWDYNAGVVGWGKIPAKNGKIHVFAMGNIPTKTNDNYIQIRLDYVKGGTMKISNFIYAKGNKEVDWSVATEDQEAKMVETGIDIENRKLTFTADNTTFKDNNGNKIAVFNSKGFNADLINTKELSLERLICYNNKGEKLYSVNEANDGCPKFYYPNGVVMKEDAFIYDDDGNINGVETRYYDASGKLKWKSSDTGTIITNADITCGWTVLNLYYLSLPPTPEERAYLKRRERIESNKAFSKFYTTDKNDDVSLDINYDNRFCYGAKTNQNPASIPLYQWVTGYILEDLTNYRGDDIWHNPPFIVLRERYLRRYENGKHISSKDIYIQ